MSTEPLVVAENVYRFYQVQRGLRAPRLIEAVNGVDLEIFPGELIAIVGESGSGKSTLGRMMVRLTLPTDGRILFDGREIASLKRRELIEFHSEAQIIFQNPYQSLNPRMRIGSALNEVLRVWSRRREAVRGQSVEDLLEMVHLPADYAPKYPHELSGGERQRVAIARAMAIKPRFVVADEPVSSLDVSAAAHIVNLLLEVREKTNLTCAFITHDIGLARLIADRIAVMYRGTIVDIGRPDDIFERPTHEYTKSLIGAQLHVPRQERPAVGADAAPRV